MKRSSFAVVMVGMSLAAGVAFAGCASFQADICAYGVCKGDGSVIPEQDAGNDVGPADSNVAGCPDNEDPAANPDKCLVDDVYAFVSATAAPGGTGSKLRPFRTLGEAIGTTKPRVIVCEGTYTERVAIGRPVEIFSRTNCAFTGPGARAQLFAPEGQETAMFVSQVTGFKLVDMEVSGPAKGVPNSIGVVFNAARSSKVVRSVIKAGSGENGENGVLMEIPNITDKAGSATGATGGSQTCGAEAAGGMGGQGGSGAQGGGAGGPAGAGGAGGDNAMACAGAGTGGSPLDTATSPPAARMSKLGALSEVRWTPAAGTKGSIGAPGKGGGGGAGKGGTGGGGGAGGCGGAGGGGGGGGGASFAVLSAASDVSFVETELQASTGGRGGRGVVGQQGQPGGDAAAGASSGCAGGGGGRGGGGGAGGGGAGGLSVGIAYSGTKPTWDAKTSFKVPSSNAGQPGIGGDSPTNDGISGKAADEMLLPE